MLAWLVFTAIHDWSKIFMHSFWARVAILNKNLTTIFTKGPLDFQSFKQQMKWKAVSF